MVKFTKQFEGELVPEWKEAFVDYWQLKKHIKKIHSHSTSPPNLSKQKQKRFFIRMKFISLFGNQCGDHKLIHVHSKLLGASTTGRSSKQQQGGVGVVYETELLEPHELDGAASEFFGLLDDQLNKVNEFYIKKEKEFVDRHECLEKQLRILVDLKTALLTAPYDHHHKSTSSKDDDQDASTISATISCDEKSSSSGIKDLEESGEKVAEEEEDHLDNVNESSPARSEEEAAGAGGRMRSRSELEDGKFSSSSDYCNNWRGAAGKSLKIQIPLTNPTRTFSYLLWEDLINQTLSSFSSQKHNNIIINAAGGGGSKTKKKKQLYYVNKTKVHHAEKMIRQALIELYKGFGYLKTYRNLNMLAFAKILKKFDKVTNKQVLPLYLKVVESSYFNTSNKIVKLADEVEEVFVKHFAQDDRRKAMKYLKPTHHNTKDSHSLTFFIGLFTGCFIALFVGYAFMAHSTGTYKPQTHTIYMETVYPLLSMFSLLFLHFFLYGCNIFMWRQTRINYRFIFELSPTRQLKSKDVFLICTLSMTVVVGVLFVHLLLMDRGYSYSQVQLIPALLLLVFLVLLVCPINIVYKSSRYRLLSVLRNIVLSPLYKVAMLDFFMADQLCSQVPMLRNLEYVACYYITGSYKTQDYGYCVRTKNYRDLAYAVSFLPYYWRAMQCARRWLDEGETGHLINLGKYVSAMLAAGAKVAYEKERSVGWLCLVVIMSSIATVYQLYWDFVKDWGLLQINSKNPWLRNELILRRKFIYFFSMGLNLVLRLAWLQTVLHYKFGSIDYRLTGLFLAALEVIRRGQWNFYRLENEHLNNAGKFRAVKTVPLPFHEVDEHD